jgi:molybdenum storage protein
MSHPAPSEDQRYHLDSRLMRESLLDKDVQKSTEVPVFRMLPDTHVIKIGGRSIMDAGRAVTYPVVEALATCLASHKLIVGTGGGQESARLYHRD